MSTLPDSVTARVPGSTSNCGAGFDTLGLALRIYNQVTLRRSAQRTVQPIQAGERRGQRMVENTAAAFFRRSGIRPFGFDYSIGGDVPPARGLGSSVTVIGGVLAGLNVLSGARLTKDALVAAATELEGHPDNASAGILGGFCVARCHPATNVYVDTIRIRIPDTIAFVVVSPASEMLTKESRGVLPSTLPYFDAVKSINSASYLVAAFATGDFARLRHAVSDFMHEPYRLPRIPGGRPAIEAGIQAGAYTGWLSGSGSSVLCVCDNESAKDVAAAMQQAFGALRVPSEANILFADNDGVTFV